MNSIGLGPVCCIPLLGLVLSTASWATETLTFGVEEMATWRHPQGLVDVSADGVVARRFGTHFNAVANADSFESRTIGVFGSRTIRTPHRQDTADRVADQDPDTWWQPITADSPERKWIEIDLGRVVVADRIRLVFPDTTDASPFRFFSVFTSPGAEAFGSDGRIVYSRLRPVTDNDQRVVDFDLISIDRTDNSAPFLISSDTLNFEFVRFIRFESTDVRPDAALAEIEVRAVGFNLASRVEFEDRVAKGQQVWGGRTWTSDARNCSGCGRGSGADALIDGDLARRRWAIETSATGDWRNLGIWSVVDLGSVFRVNRLVWLPLVYNVSRLTYSGERDRGCNWLDLDFLTSDGQPSNQADPEVEGPFEYQLLSSVDNGPLPRRSLYDFQFPSRDTRLILWRLSKDRGRDADERPTEAITCRALQLFIFHSEGYPVQVELESENVVLAKAFSIRRVEWDADIPIGTRIEVSTRTGDGFDEVTRYHLINGREVTKAAYDAAKSRNRGEIVVEKIYDPTWSEWRVHRFSGQSFQSPSPRRWLRVRTRLISEDPERMPVLRSISFVMNTPVITGGLVGSIQPREAALDSLTQFLFRIQPLSVDSRDPGFDRVFIELPLGSEDVKLKSAAVGGEPIMAAAQVTDGALEIRFPPPAVKRDSVTIVFEARLAHTPSVFQATVAHSSDGANSQNVRPTTEGADIVHVPSVTARNRLLLGVEYDEILTPNGDGFGDLLTVSFLIVKTTVPTVRVRIHDLAGRAIADLEDRGSAHHRMQFTWDGRAASGQRVPPGIYLIRIQVHSDAREETVTRLVHVVY